MNLPEKIFEVSRIERRNLLIDNARGIGILCVVIGHAPGISKAIHDLIFSFHVPLFFFLSGFSFKDSSLNESFSIYIKKLVKSLLVPFIFFWLVSYLYWLPTHSVGGNLKMYSDYTVLTPIFGLLKATGDSMPMNPALWFFTALFFISLIYWLLLFFVKNTNLVLGSSFLISMFFVFYSRDNHILSYWNIDIAFSCIFFFSFEHFLKNLINKFDLAILSKMLLISLAVFLFWVLIFFSGINSSVDISKRVFGISPILFFLNSIFGFIIILLISKVIVKNNFLQYLSRNSLVLFSLHMVAFRLLTAILVVGFGLTRPEMNNGYFNIIYTCWAIIFLIPVVYFLRAKCPFVLGGRK